VGVGGFCLGFGGFKWVLVQRTLFVWNVAIGYSVNTDLVIITLLTFIAKPIYEYSSEDMDIHNL